MEIHTNYNMLFMLKLSVYLKSLSYEKSLNSYRKHNRLHTIHYIVSLAQHSADLGWIDVNTKL